MHQDTLESVPSIHRHPNPGHQRNLVSLTRFAMDPTSNLIHHPYQSNSKNRPHNPRHHDPPCTHHADPGYPP
ncbi:hypothetical protein IAQ61_003694 [Plenodomus lingam]|uniref:uncharacterized protein n=1 Tax=Leptosphaeria maculans TaxID=5022 RepID=UPI00332079B1|nr:hypothetical protein IAQ61_003694 [Plenodomus lingam]